MFLPDSQKCPPGWRGRRWKAPVQQELIVNCSGVKLSQKELCWRPGLTPRSQWDELSSACPPRGRWGPAGMPGSPFQLGLSAMEAELGALTSLCFLWFPHLPTLRLYL